LEIEKNLPSNDRQQLIETIFREAHSLKGAARSVNLQSILEICQTLETVLSLWKQDQIEISSDAFDILHAAIDHISKAIVEPLDPSVMSNILEKLSSLTVKHKDQSLAEKKPLKKAEENIQE